MAILKVIFCRKTENVEHHVISCYVARLIWSIVHCVFNFRKKLGSIQELFGVWLRSFDKDRKKMVMAGISVVLWTIWNTRK